MAARSGPVQAWSGTVPASAVTRGDVAIEIAALGLAVAAGATTAALGSLLHPFAFTFAAVPVALWLPWVSWRRGSRAEARRAPRSVAATARRLVVEGRAYRVARATYDDGWLRAHGASGLPSVALQLSHRDAVSIVDALAVRDAGVRSVHVFGPLAQRRVIGTAATLGLALAALAVVSMMPVALLLLAFGMAREAAMLAIATVLATAVLAAALAPRTLTVTDESVEIRWLGTVRRESLERVARLELEGDEVVLEVRGGAVRKMRLWPASTTRSQRSFEAMRAAARARARGPLSLYRAGDLARTFE